MINGTDVPVEPIDPLASFYASVSRKTLKGEPEGGFEPDEKMTREQALKSYTLDAAYGEFEEAFKGSIEVGKTDKNHGAFQPVGNPIPPTVKNTAWPKNEMDRFILAKLEDEGIAPSEQADRRTLIRRAYFDLIGLPPTVEEVHLFIRDESPDAWEKVIDKLLASPQYGERWGRHWLDVARYSDTKGQFNRNRDTSSYPYAWTYRDYVINAFNEDKPYDQFIVEQIAADKLPGARRDKETLAALGFLTVGDRFNGMTHDIINDRIDVTTKAFLGMTVSCARCHDHMFDPIPTEDYYALHGVFNSSYEPNELPVITEVGSVDEQNDYQRDDAGHVH